MLVAFGMRRRRGKLARAGKSLIKVISSKPQVFLHLSCCLLVGCLSAPARNSENLCAMFEDKRGWYKSARAAESRWGIPIAVNMAFINQESSFEPRAKPARRRILGFIPGSRPSSAYGFAQALDSTWQQYERESGNRRASRTRFEDAVDFVAWYNAGSVRASGIPAANARDLYLAYHEGNGGFQQGSYAGKTWLLNAAQRVADRTQRYQRQLNGCRDELNRNWLQRLFS